VRAAIIGILRSRVGVALILSVIVLGTIGIARIFGDNSQPSSFSPNNFAPQSSADASRRPFGPDDGVVSPLPTVSPSVAKGAAPPLQVAAAFAASWLERTRTAKDWLAALRPHSTQQLLAQLDDVDPSTVPATRITDDITLVTLSESAVQAIVPMDSGRLKLRLVGPDGHWFVDGVDWERL
jgi:hypothetical protein